MIFVDLTDNGLVFIVFYYHPTNVEFQNYADPGSRVQIREGLIYNQVFFTLKVGDENWMDCPYCYYKSTRLSSDGLTRLLSNATAGKGLPVEIILYNESGIISDQYYTSSPLFAKKLLRDLYEVISQNENIITHEVIEKHEAVIKQVYESTPTMLLVQQFNNNRCNLKPKKITLRKSQKGVFGIQKIEYPGLSDELENYHYYYQDSGHVIMAIPKSLLPKAEERGNYDRYEVPFPVKYVLENGYQKHNGYLICDGEYSPVFGLIVPDKYYEW